MTGLPAAEPTPARSQLKRDAVGLPRVIAFTAAFIGPAASIVLGLVVAVSFAGYATPLVVLLSFVAALCAASCVAQFAQRLPSAGSFFTYNAAGLGKPAGFVSGWLMAFAYVIFVPAGVGATASFLTDFFQAAFHVSISENIFVVVVIAFIALLAYEGIQTSASVDIIVLVVEMVVITAVAVTIFARGGAGPVGGTLFNPANTIGHSFGNLALGMVYTVVIFTGFESGAVLGEESRDPQRIIPRGIFGAVTIVGLFYLFVAWAEMHGVSPAALASFAASSTQLQFLTSHYWSASVLWLIDLVVALSTLAFTISTFNAGVRLLFAMGRERVLPHSLASVSRRHTPHVAIAAVGIFSLVVALPVTIAVGGFNTFGYIGGIAGLAFILLYISLGIGTIVAFSHRYRQSFNPWTHVVVPIIAIALFCIPLVGTFYPVPSFPYVLFPYITLAWLALGILVAVILTRRRPDLIGRLGRVFVDTSGSAPEVSAVGSTRPVPGGEGA
jgi:amino acid transporter